MRALPLLLALALAPAAAAQPTLADLDRRVTALERAVPAVSGHVGVTGAGSAHDAAALAAERRDLQAAIRAYQAEAGAYRAEADRLGFEYDRLVQVGGTAAEHRAYEAALFGIEDDARRLQGEAAMLNAWTADLNVRLQQQAAAPPTARERALRQRIAERRRADLERAARYALDRERRIPHRLHHRGRHH